VPNDKLMIRLWNVTGVCYTRVVLLLTKGYGTKLQPFQLGSKHNWHLLDQRYWPELEHIWLLCMYIGVWTKAGVKLRLQNETDIISTWPLNRTSVC
jgi:hypothetical protein